MPASFPWSLELLWEENKFKLEIKNLDIKNLDVLKNILPNKSGTWKPQK